MKYASKFFQKKILALMLFDKLFLKKAHQLIKPECFDSEEYEIIARKLLDIYQQHREVISTALFKTAIKKDKRLSDAQIQLIFHVIKDLKKVNLKTDYDFILDEIAKFARHQTYKMAIEEAESLLVKGDYDAIDKAVREASATGSSISLGLNYFEDVKDREERRWYADDEKVCTFWGILDRYLKGGLGRKELGMILAPSNRGKSIALVNLGRNALIQKKTVFHYTLEMSKEKIADRYDSCITGLTYDNLVRHGIKIEKRLAKIKQYFQKGILIKEYVSSKASVLTLLSHISQAQTIGFVPDMIIVDYADIMSPTRYYSDDWINKGKIYEELRGLAQEKNIPVWTAAQTTRAGFTKETLMEEDVGESMKKYHIADVCISLNQTPEEYDENIIRVVIIKNRDGKKYVEIKVRSMFERMQFAMRGEPPKKRRMPSD